MMSDTILRRVTAEDIPDIIRFRRMLLTDSGHWDEQTWGAIHEQLLTYLPKALKSGEMEGYIAEISQKPIGCGIIIFREQPAYYTTPNGKTAYIMNIYVNKECRGAGISKKILTHLVTLAKERGVTKIELHATKDGAPIYINKFGFKEPDDKALEIFI